jgi:hypothetical protein
MFPQTIVDIRKIPIEVLLEFQKSKGHDTRNDG